MRARALSLAAKQQVAAMTAAAANPTAHLSKTLLNSGLRGTPQRELVYRVLLQTRDHPTADEVFARVRAKRPTISLATIYNCLDALEAHNLIRAFRFEGRSTRYCSNLEPHAHFRDKATGLTHDITLPPETLDALKKLLPANCAVDDIEITFHGRLASSHE
ncbi:MAG: transcriptional repressor [Opitutaceae bacterium]|jgi:Fur family peroxide stress response transcriptional regulator|nr:transcriptional repressor [Opitutaceae bacterium]